MHIFVNLYISNRWNLVTKCAVSSDMRFVTRCFTRALAAASRRPTAACGERLQLHEPMQLQSCVGIFAQNHTERHAVAGPRAFSGLCDDEGVPLICPTCQVLAKSVLAGARLLLCMGLFSIFLLGATATRRGCEN